MEKLVYVVEGIKNVDFELEDTSASELKNCVDVSVLSSTAGSGWDENLRTLKKTCKESEFQKVER